MATGINTGVAFNTSRWAPIDLSGLILNATTLFNTHKARVLADGGIIPDEAGCLARFKLLVDNGMYENIAVSLTPRFGLKLAGDGVSVQKIYNLSGPDFIGVTQAASWLPQWNAATGSVRIQVNSSVAGYLQSASNITVQVGNSYVVSCVGKDTDPTDSVGLTLGAVIGNLPMSYCRIQKTPTQDEAYRYGTRDSAYTSPSSAGGAVSAVKTPYIDYQPSAAFFDVSAGVVTPFDNGRIGTPATATTGALYAMRSATPVIIGNPAFTGSVMQNCDGSFRDFTILNSAQSADALILSRIV